MPRVKLQLAQHSGVEISKIKPPIAVLLVSEWAGEARLSWVMQCFPHQR